MWITSAVAVNGGRSLRKTNSGGSAASVDREHVLSGSIKKDTEHGADKMARQLNKCVGCYSEMPVQLCREWSTLVSLQSCTR